MRTTMISVLAVASLLLISGCGSSGGSDDESEKATTTTTAPEAKPIAVATWAEDFCGNFEAWSDAMADASDASGDDTSPGDIESGKQALVTLFTAASDATQTLITSLEEGGVPDIDDGDQLVDDLTTKFEAVDAAAQKAKTDAEELDPPDASALATSADQLATQFQDEVGTVADSFSEIDTKYPDPDLNAALVEHCS